MGKIIWTEKAVSHLDEIYEYISKSTKTYALQFIKSLIKAAIDLENMPYPGRIVPEIGNEQIRKLYTEATGLFTE